MVVLVVGQRQGHAGGGKEHQHEQDQHHVLADGAGQALKKSGRVAPATEVATACHCRYLARGHAGDGQRTPSPDPPPAPPSVIDLHCHLLPGIDDGPADAGVSVAVAEAAYYDGVKVIAATPHAREDHPAVVASELARPLRQAAAHAAGPGGPDPVVSGAEVDMAWALGASEQDLVDVTYGGRGTDVLVETPHGLLPPGFEDRLHDVFAPRGIRVLLAHPERSRVYQRDPRRLARLLERGVLAQVTAQALVSGNRSAGAQAGAGPGGRGRGPRDRHRRPPARDAAPRCRTPSGPCPGATRPGHAGWSTDAPAAILAGEPLPPPPRAAVTCCENAWVDV